MCTPVSAAELAAATSGYATLLGRGATGEVFAGTLAGAPIAVKRLRAPPLASAAGLEALRARFRAELAALSAFRHPRLVRLLHACEDTGEPAHPFALVFELLGGGSLADHLRAEDGGAGARGALTPLQRVDAALGIAHGLKYLHGLREAGEDGAQAPVVHRDVKSANVCFAQVGGGGELYAKVIDCGLAKALRGAAAGGGGSGSGGGAAGGASFSLGVLGTPGYMAPELANAAYTVASEIYSFGVILLELLRGRRAGLATASEAREAVEDAGGDDPAPIAALAEPGVWPPAAAAALAALASECLYTRPRRRPQTLEPVVARLRALRALLAPRVPMEECPVCLEEAPAAAGVRCKAAAGAPELQRHFCCRECLQAHVFASAGADALARSAGGVPCVAGGCASPPWALEDLGAHLDTRALLAYGAGMRRLAVEAPREAAAAAAARAAREAETAAIADVGERARRLRLAAVEEDLTLRCPRCAAAFVDFRGCAALYCQRRGCGAAFCALCLKDCGGDRDAHAHVKAVHAKPALKARGDDEMYFFTGKEVAAAQKGVRLGLLAARLRALAGERGVQEALLAELARADLQGVGVSEGELRAAAGMGGGAAAAGAGGAAAAAAAAELPSARMGAAEVVARMRREPGDARVAAAGAKALADLAGRRGAPCKAACVEADAVPALLAALAAHVGTLPVAVDACKALGALAESEVGAAACLSAGAGAAVAAALTAHCASATAARAACGALIELAAPLAGREACVAGGGVAAVVAALTAHAGKVDIAEGACKALQNMADCGAGRGACVAAGAAPVLVAALVRHSDATRVVRSALLALDNVAHESTPGQEACVGGGAAPAAVAALMAHAGLADVAEAACWLLDSLASSEAGGAACVKASAVPVLLATLKKHVGVAGVTEGALGALSKSRKMRSALEEHSEVAAEPVVAALKAHVLVADVVRSACRALTALHVSVADAGAARAAVVSALNTHIGDVSTAASCCAALSSIPGKSGDAAIAALVSALKLHGTNVQYPDLASIVLDFMAFYREGPVVDADGEALAVVAALAAHKSNATVSVLGLMALSELAGSVQQASAGADIVGAAVLAFAAHSGNPRVARCACEVLIQSPVARSAAFAPSAAPLAVAALLAPDTALTACRAIASLAASEPGTDAVIAAGAVPEIVSALWTRKDDPNLAESACRALIAIAESGPPGLRACIADGAAAAVVGVLKRALPSMEKDPDTVCRACSALECLAASSAGQSACVEADAVSWLAVVIRRADGVAGSLSSLAGSLAIVALRRLGFTESGKRVRVVEEGEEEAAK